MLNLNLSTPNSGPIFQLNSTISMFNCSAAIPDITQKVSRLAHVIIFNTLVKKTAEPESKISSFEQNDMKPIIWSWKNKGIGKIYTDTMKNYSNSDLQLNKAKAPVHTRPCPQEK